MAQSHARWVRISHWIVAASVLTLSVTGFEILMVHPRLYWGQAGNDLTPALVELPISRNYRHGGFTPPTPFFQNSAGPASASRTYDIFNQNGWGRSLHFLAGWFLVVPGVVYLLIGLFDGHFRTNIWPTADAAARARQSGPKYSRRQKIAYSCVVFVAAPLIALTGLTMAPAVTAAFPWLLRVFGGYESARTIHFGVFVALVLFVLVHVVMVARSGFWRQLRAMTIGE
jgi:thiosulfate reductase cytochrome b subunit